MKQELLRMQMLAGIITESQYKAKLIEASINDKGELEDDDTMFDDRNKALGILFRKRTPEDLYDDDYEYLWIHENVVKFCEFLGYGEESLDVAGEFTDFAYPGTEDDYESLGNPNVPIESITIGMYRKVIEDFYEKPEDESPDEIPLTSEIKAYIDDAIQSAKKDGELEDLINAGFFDTDIIDNILVEFDDKFPDADDISQEVKDYIESQL
jgi:hypothetical protein